MKGNAKLLDGPKTPAIKFTKMNFSYHLFTKPARHARTAMSRIPLHNANNMPLQAPLIPDPFVPYECPGNRSLNAICQGDPEILGQYLENTPFTLNGDRFLVYVSDFTNCRKAPFMDAGIVIPVCFGEREGGYFLFEYEDNDAAIAAIAAAATGG